MIKITECPRDAMQGIKDFIPTEEKVEYINSILKAGFDTIDFGSFVSPKAIPQMQDTATVLGKLELSNSSSKLLAIIANTRGAEDACHFDEITYLGFPFSVSETFQQRNTNSSIAESLKRVEEIQSLCIRHKKQLVVYLSMAFGNPYGDTWNADIVINWAKKLQSMGIGILSLADTIGSSTPQNISLLFSSLISELKNVQLGAHLHSRKETAGEKIEAAYKNGCRNFDSAILGFGGCPMAKDDLTGNIATEIVLDFFADKNLSYNKEAFANAMAISSRIFNRYH
ncbi:MAG TPA: hydroxymethylglutaryl-CoA lyase [Bacteroidia bacterium]|nr:hydroxymethylglutaryl-CoA lyase [Bacteroidia bacterium]